MGSPALERTSIVVKDASGEHMKIHGKLKCKIKMKGVETEGCAYVTPYNSLIGLEWIRANEDMKYHLEMMTAEVKMASITGIEDELKKIYPGVFEEGLGRCNKKAVDLQFNQNVRPMLCNSRPVPHTAQEAVNAELDRLAQMIVIAPNLRGPLDGLLKKDVKWRWTPKGHKAFEDLKEALSSDANLAHYNPQQKIVVAADACD
ncbi:hypothetical protein GCK32_022271 [Trichostrongylus colubriformis]|uniref:Reverse transcriptase/retrotransposon-derived protein RNase H-like domain-containing protein n=1 Tax=Trichostrongylus colubriformis TaxID=6319 RepID=A0AAN8EWV9_TRICO